MSIPETMAVQQKAVPSAGTPDGIGKRWKVIVPSILAVLALSVGAYFYLHPPPKHLLDALV